MTTAILGGTTGTILTGIDSYQSYPPAVYSTGYADNSREQAAIDRLENEVDRLREEREARESQGSQSKSKPDSQSTELVFRNKRTEEVQNYAIVGQTFWVFSEQRARKIPLADLDIPATKKANDDRGVEFAIPGEAQDSVSKATIADGLGQPYGFEVRPPGKRSRLHLTLESPSAITKSVITLTLVPEEANPEKHSGIT